MAAGESDANSRVLNVFMSPVVRERSVAIQRVPISRLQRSLQLILILLQGNSDQLAAGMDARFREELLQGRFH